MTRNFESFDEYCDFYEGREHKDNDVDIVNEYDREYPLQCADATMACKSWKTAVKRLAKATGWNWILDELDADEHMTEVPKDCDGVAFESVYDGDGWYIYAVQHC